MDETGADHRPAGGTASRESELLFYTPEEAASVLRLSRRTVFRMLACGELPSTLKRRRRLIPAQAIRDFAEVS